MLRIRLQRSGRRNRPNYRVVVAEHSAPIKGRYLEMLGTFDPLVEKHGFIVDTAKIEGWIKKGARPTDTVARILKGQGLKGMEPFIVEMKDRNKKKVEEEKPIEAAPAAEVSVPAAEGATDKSEVKPEEAVPAETSAEEKAEEVPDEEPASKEPKEKEKPVEEAPLEKEKKEEAPAEEGDGEPKEEK